MGRNKGINLDIISDLFILGRAGSSKRTLLDIEKLSRVLDSMITYLKNIEMMWEVTAGNRYVNLV